MKILHYAIIACFCLVLVSCTAKKADQEIELVEDAPIHADVDVLSPKEGAILRGEFIIKGEARGFWFSEGSIDISLESSDGTVLASTSIPADGEWMTNQFVEFMGRMRVPDNVEGEGELVVHKANASGLIENEDEARVPIQYGPLPAMQQ